MTSHLENTVDKWRALVDRLVFYTNTKQVIWKSSADEATFISRISGNQISISEVENQANWENPDYVIRIYNKNGEVVDSFSDEDISDNSNPYYRKMMNLYRTVVRLNNGSEDILNELLKELPDPDEIPF